MVGRDTPEPIRSGRPCKTSHGAGCGQRTENPPALAVGSMSIGGVLMTITGIARFVQQNYKVQNSHLTHKLPNGSLPPKEHVNPYCPEGMDITGRTDFRRIVPVDEGVANKIKSLVFESMEKNCGMSDGEIESEIIRNYVMSLPPEERAAAGWTLNQISLQEADRLGEYVHQRDPSWNWGKPVKPGILDDYKSGMNILI